MALAESYTGSSLMLLLTKFTLHAGLWAVCFGNQRSAPAHVVIEGWWEHIYPYRLEMCQIMANKKYICIIYVNWSCGSVEP